MIQNKQEVSLKTKNQIQLIKQKYLKKNIPNNERNNPKQQTAPKVIVSQKNSPTIKKQQIVENKINYQLPVKQILKQKPIKQVNKEIKSNQKKQDKEWSLKNYLQVQLQGDKIKKSMKEKIQLQNIKFNHKDPFGLNIQFRFPIKQELSRQNNDPQFQQKISHVQVSQKKINPIRNQVDISYACKLWTQSPYKSLLYLYFSQPNTQLQQQTLYLKSNNPQFPGIVQGIAEQFIFSNNQVLKQSQKQVVYNMALQYFSPSPKYLSDVLLISLIKLTPSYANIYVDQIIRQMNYYIQRIIKLKKYVLKQQVDNFVKLIEQRLEVLRVQGRQVNIQHFVCLLILRPNSNYCHQVLLTRSINEQKDLLAIFCILTPDGKELTLSILYLKCIDALVPVFIRTGIIQKVISNLNEIRVPQVLYQPVKFLKLKLIKAGDTTKQKKKTQQDKSFINFLNEKVGKLKQVLDNKVSPKLKPQIYYNRISGKYQQAQVVNSSKPLN